MTDSGLVHLKRLTRLEALKLDDTQITEVGLLHLKGLMYLDVLSVNRLTPCGLIGTRA